MMKKKITASAIATTVLFIMGMGAVNAEVLLSDGFGAAAIQDTNINLGIPGRQTGSQQPITWSKTGTNGGGGVLLAEHESSSGNANLFLEGISVGSWDWARGWASPNKNWIGWDNIRFSMDINPVNFGGPTVGKGGFFVAGGSQGWGGGRMQVAINNNGTYNVYDNVLGVPVASGIISSGWHNWAAELKKYGTKHVLSLLCDGSIVLPDYSVGVLTSSYITLSHEYNPSPGDWSWNMSRFDNFAVESISSEEEVLFMDDFSNLVNPTTNINDRYVDRQAGSLGPATWSDMEESNDRGLTELWAETTTSNKYLSMGTRSYDPAGGIPYNRYSWASPDINFVNQDWIRLSFDMYTATLAPAGTGDIWAGCSLGGGQGMNEDKLYFNIYNDYDAAGNLISSKYHLYNAGIEIATGNASIGWHHVVIDLMQMGQSYMFSLSLDGTPIATDQIAGNLVGQENYINFLSRHQTAGWTYSMNGFDNIKIATVLSPKPPAPAYSKGREILLDRGLQLQACVIDPNAFSLSRFAESNFTGVDFGWGLDPTSNISAIAGATGLQWSAYVGDWSGPDENVTPYMPNLTSLQYFDEQDLFSTDTEIQGRIEAATSTFAQWRVKYPNVISRTNQGGSQLAEEDLRTYVRTAQPGMIMFDYYSFSGSLPGGSPSQLYTIMQKYRTVGLEGYDGTGSYPIPYGQYFQTSRQNGHTPSESEIRLQQFASWAFGYTVLEAFLYSNSGDVASGLFNGPGDSSPTSAFYYTAAANQESRNLGNTLIRLVSKGLWMKMGQGNTQPTNISAYSTGNVPYLTGVSATNNGTLNSGKSGDVIIGKFNLLDESFDGNSYTGETYFMITNGLCDPNGSAAQTQQTIRLNFNFGTSGITSLKRISRTTGSIETVSLVHDSGSLYHLDLVLPGGTGDLFKFNTGASFVGEPVSPISIAQAKGNADGQIVSCTGSVTYASNDVFYIQKADKIAGIRVIKTGHGKTVGQGVTVVGQIGTDANGERVILATSLSSGVAETILPIGANNKALGGGNLNYSYDNGAGKTLSGQKGVIDGAGLNNIALLMKSWGNASGADSEGFVLSDGSGVSVKVLSANSSQYNGKYVSVTGVNSMDSSGQRVILATHVQIEQ